ncbi:hypothetical protein BPC006_II1399 [Burkholderia pseudomallei BPC006]|nr:hypothetical protein BPC006_II1399 [Burkholderia pseudomallei BPC006]
MTRAGFAPLRRGFGAPRKPANSPYFGQVYR